MSQKLESTAELHSDHRLWKSYLSMWQFDIEQWQREHEQAQSQLKKITEMIRQQERSLNEHVRIFESITAELEFHEKNMAASLRVGAVEELDNALLAEHAEEAKKFAAQRAVHERIKKHHHIAMAHVASLQHALEAAL